MIGATSHAVGAYSNHWHRAGLREDNFIYRLFEVDFTLSFEKLADFWYNVVKRESHFGYGARLGDDDSLHLVERVDPLSAICEVRHVRGSNTQEKYLELSRTFWDAKRSVKFDGEAALLKVSMVEFDDGSKFLILLLHHIIIDELAMLSLMKDMEGHFGPRGPVKYSSLSNAFTQYTKCTQSYVENVLPTERDYWLAVCEGAKRFGLVTDELLGEENLELDQVLLCYKSLFAPAHVNNQEVLIPHDVAAAYIGLVLERFTGAQMLAVQALKADPHVVLELIFIWAIAQAVMPWRSSTTLWMDLMTNGRNLFGNTLHLFGARCSCVELCTVTLNFEAVQSYSDPRDITRELSAQRQKIPTKGFGYHALELPFAQELGLSNGPLPHPSIEFNFTAPVKEVFDREADNSIFHHTEFFLGPQYDPELAKYDLYFGVDKPTGSKDWTLCIRFNTSKFSYTEAKEISAALLRSIESAAAALRI